ncbi:hypothetical protein ACHAXT_005748 [Thalassiosira profunda]
MDLLLEGFFFSASAVVLVLAFEFGLAAADVKRLQEREGGKELYRAGLIATIFNHLVLGPITYYLTLTYCTVDYELNLWQQAFAVLKFVVIENGLYFVGHYLMHTRQLYWMHRFHHRFNAVVLPSSASAVSVPEFIFAYMSPFLAGAYFGACDKNSALAAVSLVAFFNLVIHTPSLEEAFENHPWIFVSPGDHLAHHRQLACSYSAPIFHFDRMLSSAKEAMHSLRKSIKSKVP